MSPVPPTSPAAPVLAAAVLVFLLTLTALSVRLCIVTGIQGPAPIADGEVSRPEAFAATMAHFGSPRR